MRSLKRAVQISAIGTVFLLLAGCATTPLHVPMPELEGCEATHGRMLSERACGVMLGGVIPIGMTDRYERAYHSLIQQAPSECVADIKMQEELTYIFVGWRFCTFLAATAYAKRAPQPVTAR